MTADLRFLTFDCYGTLVDWEQGITTAFAHIARQTGHDIDLDRVLELHARIEPQLQAEEFRRYRDILDSAAVRIAEETGLVVPVECRRFLSQSLPQWPPFADTLPALARLRAGGDRLGILSNVDDDLLRATLEHLPIEFDLLVTAEQVGSYKPAVGHFLEARRRIGESSWIHVAQSLFHDVRPARALGVPVVWIDRQSEQPPTDLQPSARFPDLGEFAARLLDRGGLGGS